MRIGVPKEIKANENRIALVPAGVEAFVSAGHTVMVEAGAGLGSGFEDHAFRDAGAELIGQAEAVWERADLIMKVKEPIAPEWPRMRPGQVIYTYFHFAASEELTLAVIDSGAIAVAYETVQLDSGELPLLTPMSEVAGRMAVQEGAKYLEKIFGGRGILLGGVPGVVPGEVVIFGGGVVGTNAAQIAAGFGAHVTILDIDLHRLRYLADVLPANVDTVYSNRHNILDAIRRADLVIGAVLLPGAKAPSLVTRADLTEMMPGSVIVDVAVDRRWHPALRGGEYAWGGAPHIDSGADQRHTFLRPASCTIRLEIRLPGRSGSHAWAQYRRGAGGVSWGGRGIQPALGRRRNGSLTQWWRSSLLGCRMEMACRFQAWQRRARPGTTSPAPTPGSSSLWSGGCSGRGSR
jgi:alanine dehydrogenase